MTLIGLLVFFLGLTTINAQSECSNNRATCINIRNCPSIIQILQQPRPLSEEALQTLRNSQCGFQGNDPMVCCVNEETTSSTTTTTTTPRTTTSTTSAESTDTVPPPPDVSNHRNLRLLDHQQCGPVATSKVIGGNKTGILDYPWMALIAYDTGKPTPEFRCGGTIISSRYILTAAHCVTTLPSGLRLVGVRVGDHDISTERDCDKDKYGLELQCADRYQDFAMESVHYHSEYTRTKLQNDIALIRVNRSIDFTPLNVKPICLPFGSAATITRRKLTVTGWGATQYGQGSSDLLQASLPIVTNKQCTEKYKRNTQIWYKQLCAGGQDSVDSCLGDSGGPLQTSGIYTHNGNRMLRTVQYGVVSYGLRHCGTEGYPGVYTRVAYYMDWILNTMTD